MADPSNKPRLLVLTSTFPRWAGDREPPFVFELSRRLADTFDVHVLAPHAAGARREEFLGGLHVHRFRYAPETLQQLAYDGGILARLRQRRWRLLLVPCLLAGQWWALRRLLRREHFDAIHAHWLVPQALVAILAGVPKSCALLCTSHGGDLFGLRGRLLGRLKRGILARCTSVTVVSAAMRDEVQRLRPGQAVDIIPMGTDLAECFTPSPTVAREPNAILFAGRLVEKKGVAYLIDAIARLRQQGRSVVLRIAGSGPELETLRAQAQRLGIASAVDFLGAIDHTRLADLYRQASVAVVPSVVAASGDQEGFGLVIVEAMGCECPVVASRLPAIDDIAIDGETALLVPPADPAALADAIATVLDDPSAAGRRAMAARVRVLERFDWVSITSRYAALLLRLVGASTRILEARMDIRERQGHAVLDVGSRNAKARKIEALLGLTPTGQPLRMLEVGTGSGGIAHYFGTHTGLRCEVDAVDVTDTRQIHDGYRFTQVQGVDLPFPDGHFDVVISNHVIEHVGDSIAQRRHLTELRRVLRSDGVGYLAVPSRWQVVEPHYRLAFLSWLPQAWRTPYLRLRHRGSHYDCRPLAVPQIEALLRESGFSFVQQHGRALRLTFEIERPRALVYRAVFRWLPESLYATLRRTFPTLIYTITPAASGAGDFKPV